MSDFYDEENQDIYHIRTHAAGPRGELPLTPAMLINRPSGDLFGMTMKRASAGTRTSSTATKCSS